MHIVILAWLFVIFTMALTMNSHLAGLAWFVIVGLGPVAVVAAIARSRQRARNDSVRERRADRGDDGDAQSDR